MTDPVWSVILLTCNWIVIHGIYYLLYTKGSLSRGSEWKQNYRRKLF
jgi:hypothetical protein